MRRKNLVLKKGRSSPTRALFGEGARRGGESNRLAISRLSSRRLAAGDAVTSHPHTMQEEDILHLN